MFSEKIFVKFNFKRAVYIFVRHTVRIKRINHYEKGRENTRKRITKTNRPVRFLFWLFHYTSKEEREKQEINVKYF